MKRTTRVKKSRKIGRLRASAEESGAEAREGAQARRFYKPLKKRVTLRLDADVLAWFQKKGRGYQTRINGALAAVMREQKKRSEHGQSNLVTEKQKSKTMNP
jgi:uncharacterized protein (DUF4415 family)